jgi:DNA replication initiation complex subunit (GINS family)
MILTYEKIREVKLNEKSDKLQKLPPNFFENAFNYIKLKKGTVEETSAKALVTSIFELRLKKIVNLALLLYKSNKIPENLEKDEEELYLSLVQIFRGVRDVFEKKLELENKETEKKENNLKNLKKVRFLVDIPEIYLPSLGICCFKKGEIKELDESITSLLLEKRFCELV